MQHLEQPSRVAPPAPTSLEHPSNILAAGLTKVLDPNPSESFEGLGGMNLLQQIEAGTGPEDPAVRARGMGLSHYPFSSLRDWDLGHFLATSSLSQAEIDKFLKLNRVLEPFIVQRNYLCRILDQKRPTLILECCGSSETYRRSPARTRVEICGNQNPGLLYKRAYDSVLARRAGGCGTSFRQPYICVVFRDHAIPPLG